MYFILTVLHCTLYSLWKNIAAIESGVHRILQGIESKLVNLKENSLPLSSLGSY